MNVILYSSQRKDTTGVYVKRAFDELGLPNIHVDPLRQPIPNGADLYVLVDDGFDYGIKGEAGRLAYWAIDTHVTMDQCIRKSQYADFVFAAQESGTKPLMEAINKPVWWLPLACDSTLHSIPGEKVYDVCFVGNAYPGVMTKRINMLDALFRKFPNFFYGQCYFKEMAEVYGKSKLIFNCSLSGDVNMRVYEAMCSGVLVTDNVPSLAALGIDQTNCIIYDNEKDMLDKVAYFLEHDAEREAIAKNAQAFAQKNTYKDRVAEMLRVIGGSK